MLPCAPITYVEFGGSVKQRNLVFCKLSTPKRWRPASASGEWRSGQVHSWWFHQIKIYCFIGSSCTVCQSSCFRWSFGGEWERRSKLVDCWQRVRALVLSDVYRFLWEIQVNLDVKWHSPPSGCRRSGRKPTTCTSTPSHRGDGASSPPTRGWCCMRTGQGLSSQTSEWEESFLQDVVCFLCFSRFECGEVS